MYRYDLIVMTPYADQQALDALRFMEVNVPAMAVEKVKQTRLAWPALSPSDKLRHYATVRRLCERSAPALRRREGLRRAEEALTEAVSPTFHMPRQELFPARMR